MYSIYVLWQSTAKKYIKPGIKIIYVTDYFYCHKVKRLGQLFTTKQVKNKMLLKVAESQARLNIL